VRARERSACRNALIELASWNPFENAFGLAAWLDRLEPCGSDGRGERDRTRGGGRPALGLDGCRPSASSSTGTLTAAWREHTHVLTPKGASDLLRTRHQGGHPRGARVDRRRDPKNYSVGLFRRLQEDRAAIPGGQDTEQLAASPTASSVGTWRSRPVRRSTLGSNIIGERRSTDDEISQRSLSYSIDRSRCP